MHQPAFDAAGLNICKWLYAQPGSTEQPYFAASITGPVVPGDACASGTSAPAGVAFYTGGSYPAGYTNVMFLADYARQCIWMMLPGPNGLPDPSTRRAFRTVPGGPVDLEIGPGGDLFYVDFNGRRGPSHHVLGEHPAHRRDRPPTSPPGRHR